SRKRRRALDSERSLKRRSDDVRREKFIQEMSRLLLRLQCNCDGGACCRAACVKQRESDRVGSAAGIGERHTKKASDPWNDVGKQGCISGHWSWEHSRLRLDYSAPDDPKRDCRCRRTESWVWRQDNVTGVNRSLFDLSNGLRRRVAHGGSE